MFGGAPFFRSIGNIDQIITAFDAGDNDQFGASVAISGDKKVVAIGAYLWDSTYGDIGVVYVYDIIGPSLVFRGYLQAPVAHSTAYFGASVALNYDGTILAVGTLAVNSGAGRVDVYSWSGSSWTSRHAIITASDAGSGDSFGRSVSLDTTGDILVVGAEGWDGTYSAQGAVYRFEWSGSAYAQMGGPFTIAVNGGRFGWSVSLSGDGSSAAVGMVTYTGSFSNQGRVDMIAWSGSAWSQITTILPNDPSVNAVFGRSVWLSPDSLTLFVGASGWDGTLTDQGGVYRFDYTTSWVQSEIMILSTDPHGSDNFGWSVASDAAMSVVCVGAPTYDNGGTDQGAVELITI